MALPDLLTAAGVLVAVAGLLEVLFMGWWVLSRSRARRLSRW